MEFVGGQQCSFEGTTVPESLDRKYDLESVNFAISKDSESVSLSSVMAKLCF
jgi:hypothetical protein